MMLTTYEFHRYHATPDGDVSAEPVEKLSIPCFGEGAAKTAARKMARTHQGPVDVAVAGPSPWNDRYIGTASPKYPYSDCKITEWERLS